MPNIDVETIGTIVGAVLTLLVFSYVLGDNPLYRLALHLFIGALVGYSFGILVREVLLMMALVRLLDNPILVIPLLMGLGLFFFKSIHRFAYVGNYFIAYLIGVGTAVALYGAFMGTLVPQVEATSQALSLGSPDLPDIVRGLLIVSGTVFTLMAFHFTAHKQQGLAGVWARVVGGMGKVGRWFLLVTFGVAFAGALTASLSIFIGRIQYLIKVSLKIAELLGI